MSAILSTGIFAGLFGCAWVACYAPGWRWSFAVPLYVFAAACFAHFSNRPKSDAS